MNMDKMLRNRFLIICLMFVVVLLIAVPVTMAWLTSGKEQELYGMKMVGADTPFEIEVRGENIENGDDFEKADSSYDLGDLVLSPAIYQTSGKKNKIIWRKTTNTNDDGHYEQGIGPNAHGKLTFWVVAKNDGILDVEFVFRVRGFLGTYVEGGQENDFTLKNLYEINEQLTVTEENELKDAEDLEKKLLALEFIKGHILFFSDYDGETGFYSGFLGTGRTIALDECIDPMDDQKRKYGENGSFIAEKGKKYQVTIYWKWANTLEQIVLDETSPEKDDPLLFSGNVLDRNEMFAYLNDSEANKVFQGYSSEKISAYLNDIKNNTGAFGPSLAILDEAYDNADLIIGNNIDYIMIEMTAQNR